jgi:hypothetical protein
MAETTLEPTRAANIQLLTVVIPLPVKPGVYSTRLTRLAQRDFPHLTLLDTATRVGKSTVCLRLQVRNDSKEAVTIPAETIIACIYEVGLIRTLGKFKEVDVDQCREADATNSIDTPVIMEPEIGSVLWTWDIATNVPAEGLCPGCYPVWKPDLNEHWDWDWIDVKPNNPTTAPEEKTPWRKGCCRKCRTWGHWERDTKICSAGWGYSKNKTISKRQKPFRQQRKRCRGGKDVAGLVGRKDIGKGTPYYAQEPGAPLRQARRNWMTTSRL